MPTPIELSNRLHRAQLATVTRVQDLTVGTVAKLADIRERAPKAPARATRFTEPLTEQLASYRQDWEKSAKVFKERLDEAARHGSAAPQPVKRPTVVKNASSKKS